MTREEQRDEVAKMIRQARSQTNRLGAGSSTGYGQGVIARAVCALADAVLYLADRKETSDGE